MSHAIQYNQTTLTETQRKQQTQLIMKLFELWRLSNKQQAIALGLSPNTATSIHRYKIGKQYLPLFRDIQDRIENLLIIHQLLRRIYQFNKELAYQWITTPNADFNYLSPLETIYNEGYLGLSKIRTYLEINQLS